MQPQIWVASHSQGRRAGAVARAKSFEMSARIADIVNDSEGTQSESDDSDHGQAGSEHPSSESCENSGSDDEKMAFGEDRPRKSSKARYKRKKADQPRIW